MNRHFIALLFFAVVSHAGAATDAPTDPSIKQFVEIYFTSWSKADFTGYRSCFHASATVTFKDGEDWRRWELQEFLNDQEYLQSKHKMEEVPLAIHVKAVQGDVAFVEVPWKLKLLPSPEEATGIDWYVLVRHEKTWQILNLTFWQDAKDTKAAPANDSSSSGTPQPQSKPKIIVSGFEKFGGRPINASSELAKAISESFPDMDITFVQVPVVWGAPEKTIVEDRKLSPAVWIAFGEGANDFQIETVANNRRAKIRDNNNELPAKEEIIAGGPQQLKLTAPADAISAAMQKLGYAPKISSNAGGYLCEEMLYSLLDEQQVANTTLKQAVFIHVPVYGTMVRIHGRDVPFSGDNLRTAAHDIFQAVAESLQLDKSN